MLLQINDRTAAVKENFIQSLVLLYLPCESFSRSDSGEKSLTLTVDSENGFYRADVLLKVGDKTARASDTAPMSDEESAKLQVKKLIGKVFLTAAEEMFGYHSPWGIVTGIRPAKLAGEYRKKYSSEETARILQDEYFVAPERAMACVRTAENESKLVEALNDRSCSLYISIPFCPSKCRYCSFVSSTTPKLLALIPAYLEALMRELASIAETVDALGLTLESVYVGGGTPAILDAGQISRLLDCVHTHFALTPRTEFTFEAGRPDCITAEKLKALHSGGATRISINTQTANNAILAAVGRKHTFEDYVKCMYLAREIGIDCINTDLIAGLPGETAESFFESIDKVVAVMPENITVHSFTLKRSSEYKTTGQVEIDSSSRAALQMISYASRQMFANGYEPYYMYRQKNTVGNLDNTGYAKPGTACLYNVYMMGEYHTVFAAGAGAVNKYVSADRERIERVFSPKYPYEYLDKEKYAGFDAAFAHKFYETVF